MKLTINREQLVGPLAQACAASPSRATLPILSFVRLAVDTGSLTLTGSDLEVEVTSVIRNADLAAEPGTVMVPSGKFLAIVKSLPAGVDISLNQTDRGVIVVAGRSRFTLAVRDAADFPDMALEADGGAQLTSDCSKLAELLRQTSYAMGRNDVREYLNGLYLAAQGKTICAVATDGHRLAKATLPVEVAAKAKFEPVIVPNKGVGHMLRLLESTTGDCSLALSANHIKASTSQWTMTSKLLAGKYPDYERVIPTAKSHTLVVAREALVEAVARAGILANETYRGLRAVITKTSLDLVGTNPENEEAVDSIDAKYSGKPMEIGLRADYLRECLAATRGDTVTIALIDPNSSVVVAGQDSSTCMGLIMPMRL